MLVSVSVNDFSQLLRMHCTDDSDDAVGPHSTHIK